MMDSGMAQGGGFPSADPSFVAQVLAQVVQAQQADQAKLAAAQHMAVVQNPLMAALLGGDASGAGAGAMGATPGEAMPEGAPGESEVPVGY